MTSFTCRNCGHKHTVKFIISSKETARYKPRGNTFENVAHARGIIGLFNRVVRNKPLPLLTRQREILTVKVDYRISRNQWRLQEFQFPAWCTEDNIRELADKFLRPTVEWKRSESPLSTNRHIEIQQIFINLGMLKITKGTVLNPRGYALTEFGQWFLEQYK